LLRSRKIKYVKLTAKHGHWFKPGTEVYHYDEDRRITLEEYNSWVKSGVILCRGIRTDEDTGLEFDDCELCQLDEFWTELQVPTEQDFTLPADKPPEEI